MKPNIQITPEDFDNAVKQPWNVDTCIASQAALRNGYRHADHFSAASRLRSDLGFSGPIMIIVKTFDAHFRKPGDELKPELQALRASLPITL